MRTTSAYRLTYCRPMCYGYYMENTRTTESHRSPRGMARTSGAAHLVAAIEEALAESLKPGKDRSDEVDALRIALDEALMLLAPFVPEAAARWNEGV